MNVNGRNEYKIRRKEEEYGWKITEEKYGWNKVKYI